MVVPSGSTPSDDAPSTHDGEILVSPKVVDGDVQVRERCRVLNGTVGQYSTVLRVIRDTRAHMYT